VRLCVVCVCKKTQMAETNAAPTPADSHNGTNGNSTLDHREIARLLRTHDIEVEDSREAVMRILNQLLKPSRRIRLRPKVFRSFDMDGVVRKIQECSNIVVMCGAGLSTASGIPDFRSPGTGLYDNLSKYNLPEPQALFTLSYFRENPEPFYDFCRQLWPVLDRNAENYRKPTDAHYFLTLMERKKKLLRCFSQNIDCLEELAELSSERLVACHGNFSSCRGIDTKIEVPVHEVREAVRSGQWKALTERHGELVKPDITFFGEDLSSRFRDFVEADFPMCDLLLVMGTSLVVSPFNQLLNFCDLECPRVLVNQKAVGCNPAQIYDHFRFGNEDTNYRDVFLQGELTAIVRELCRRLGWLEELDALKNGTWGELASSHNGTVVEPAKALLNGKKTAKTISCVSDDEGDPAPPSEAPPRKMAKMNSEAR